jgi:hypothetical protein
MSSLALIIVLAQMNDVVVAEHVATEERPFGVHAGLNAGLVILDADRDGLYGFGTLALGAAMLTQGKATLGVLGVGVSFPLGPPDDTMWVFDLFGEVSGGNTFISPPPGDTVFGAVGVGLGFRWLHHSGFVLGFKLPLFGAAIATKVSLQPGDAVGVFYLANLLALPLVSLGYRF